MNLPIDIVPNTTPPKFKWRRVIDTIAGMKTVECEGNLPASVEESVVMLIALVKQQQQELIGLRRMNDGLTDRVAQQSELLSKKSEAPNQPQRKGRG